MTPALLLALLPIFAVLGLGALAGRSGRIAPAQVAPLNTLVMDFALPAALFGAVTHAGRAELLGQWPLMLVLLIGLLVLWWLVFAIERRVFGARAGSAAVLAISVSLPNFAAAGVPLMNGLFGRGGGLQVAVAISLGAVVLSPMTLVLLDLDRERRRGSTASPSAALAAAARRVSRAPLVLGPLVGVVLVLAGITLPPAVDRAVGLIGQASGGVALFVTGLVLSARRIRLTGRVAAGALLANIVHPLATASLCTVLPIAAQPRQAAILLSALPCGFFGIFFALRYEEDPTEAAAVVGVSTVLSIATLAAAIVSTGAAG
ncbi:AEC family transporter [Rhizosaccharibacter radicis]|uniref:AEC family transporter n=1 Tax=Rhizosaccharibacter radicis TaxID=2782605 RepID=A0ABT1VTJ3_9PROT|nr:AEC family transporter [Acetobacteraceae bacterium KSS12]